MMLTMPHTLHTLFDVPFPVKFAPIYNAGAFKAHISLPCSITKSRLLSAVVGMYNSIYLCR